ncbi:hypothetical protein Tco_1546167 [Tanacetum coccineum]
MAQLKYCDKHNQVGFLRKPDESAGFAEIMDFIRGSNLRYALTSNPTIYDSLVKQFWQTATAKTLADGTLELHATIDTIVYTITEASIRNKLQLADASGITMLPNNEIFEGMGHMCSKSGGWDQFGRNIATTLICLSTGRIFGNMKRGFRGVPRPLLPALLSIANPSSGQEAPSVTQPQPSSKAAQGNQTDLWEGYPYFGRKSKVFGSCFERSPKRVLLSDFKEEETKAQGRKTHDLYPLVSLVQELVTPSKTPSKTVNASEEEQVEDISPTTLEAAAILTKVKKIKSVDKGKRYKRRKSSKESAGTGLDFEEDLLKLSEESKKRKPQVQLKSIVYKEDWDTIRAKLVANAELKERVLGRILTVKDLQKGWDMEVVSSEEVEFEETTKETLRDLVRAPTKLHTAKVDVEDVPQNRGEDLDKDDSEDSDEASEKVDSTSDTKIPINPIPVAIKSPSYANSNHQARKEREENQMRIAKTLTMMEKQAGIRIVMKVDELVL